VQAMHIDTVSLFRSMSTSDGGTVAESDFFFRNLFPVVGYCWGEGREGLCRHTAVLAEVERIPPHASIPFHTEGAATSI